MKPVRYKITTAFFATLLCAFNVQAVTMLVQQDGDTTPFAGWAVDGLLGADPTTGAININGGAGVALGGQTAIRIDAGTAGNPIPRTDIIYTTAPALTGNLAAYGPNSTALAGIAFDFYAGGLGIGVAGGAPSGLGVYLQSGFGSGSVWYYDITSSIVDGWSSYGAGFGSSGWYGFTDNTWGVVASDSFQNALTDVTAVGIYVTYIPSTAGQVYGIDEFGLTVPEPETYMALGMALLGMAFVFRKRITESLADARAMMQM